MLASSILLYCSEARDFTFVVKCRHLVAAERIEKMRDKKDEYELTLTGTGEPIPATIPCAFQEVLPKGHYSCRIAWDSFCILENLIMKNSFLKFSVLYVLPVMLFSGFTGISCGQQAHSAVNPASEYDYEYNNQKNPHTIRAKVSLLLSAVKARQWVAARKHYDAIVLEIASKNYGKAHDKEFEKLVGVKKSDLINLENRFRLIGEEKFRRLDSQIMKDEKLNDSKVYEAFILNPKAAEAKKDLLAKVISIYEDKIGIVFADSSFNIDRFTWNQEQMLELIHLYYLAGQYEKSSLVCMYAMNYVQTQLEEGYICSIFDRCNGRNLSVDTVMK